MPLRQAGAVGRHLLIAAAAKRWNVDPATCHAKNGVVFNASGSKHLSYGELAKAAAKLPVPPAENVNLKEPKDFTLIGTRAKRVDCSVKVDGRVLYGIDARLPGMKVAAVAISPVLGGKAKTVDEKAALAVNGVRQVVNIDEAVAVVADHMGAAKSSEAAAITWDDGPNGKVNNADIVKQLEEESESRARLPVTMAMLRRLLPSSGATARSRLSGTFPGPCGDGADELHRSSAEGSLRRLGRDAGECRSRILWWSNSPACQGMRSKFTII